MKYIISEQRLERLVINYLNTLNLEEGNYDSDGFDIIYNGSEVMAYRNKEKKLYISTDLIKDVRILFSLNQNESIGYIKNWFQDEYNVKVNSMWLLFPDEPFAF